MKFRLGMENNMEGRSMAWVLGHPGCYAYGQDDAQAMSAASQAIRDYVAWIENHLAQSWLMLEHMELILDEIWQVYDINEDYELVEMGYSVNAWFRHDWLPLTGEDVEIGLKLLTCSRKDLLAVVKGLSPRQLEKDYAGERWSIAGILGHVGGAEWWYLDRLGMAFPRKEVPEEPFKRLELVRNRLREILPDLIGSTRVVGVDGEFWSPRKLLRRAVWHERDHTQHIQKILV